jgi:hypothetical protein
MLIPLLFGAAMAAAASDCGYDAAALLALPLRGGGYENP